MLELKDLSKKYSGINAVDHVSLEILEGEFITLLDPADVEDHY